MNTFVALLRSINVSGHNIIKMADLKALLDRPEFINVSTYLQSGNVIFQSSVESPQELSSLIAHIIKVNYGFDIEVKVLEARVFRTSLDQNPFLSKKEIDTKKLYYLHLFGDPSVDGLQEITADDKFPEAMVLIDQTLYVHYINGFGRSKLSGNYIERKLGVKVTARNHNTMQNLVKKTDLI